MIFDRVFRPSENDGAHSGHHRSAVLVVVGALPRRGAAHAARRACSGRCQKRCSYSLRATTRQEVAAATAKCAAETSGNWLVGFGMAGDESVGTPNNYAYSFQLAKEAGLKLTCHAGEWCGAESVRETINELDVQRIGHGVRSIEDNNLVKTLIEREIVLEICPGSNVFLGVYPNLSLHPIKKLHDLGVKLTISTDDPPFFQTSMNDEYKALATTFGWTLDDFKELNRVALAAAFCDEDTKKKLILNW